MNAKLALNAKKKRKLTSGARSIKRWRAGEENGKFRLRRTERLCLKMSHTELGRKAIHCFSYFKMHFIIEHWQQTAAAALTAQQNGSLAFDMWNIFFINSVHGIQKIT